MVRAGEGGHLVAEFAKGVVTVGWSETGELTDKAQRDLRLRLASVYPESKAGAVQNIASVLWRFSHEVRIGDTVITYDPNKREYLVGQITSDYQYDAKRAPHHVHLRAVKWLQRVARDVLNVSTRNSLGSTLTLFAVPDEAVVDLLAAGERKAPSEPTGGLEERKDQLQQSNRDVEEQSRELIEDRILALDPYEMQDLIAAVLRAMGYRTRVSPPGSDRGVDVLASPDGLGLQEPRIKVEVKHRPNTAIGSPEIRSFVAGLRAGDKGLYLSTGGFSKEAKYEAERATHPTTLIDLAELAVLVTENYEQFDPTGRALIPLKRIYRPLE
jgi:restriction system protein